MTRQDRIELAGYHFDKKPELREEFGGDKEAYIAFVMAQEDGLLKDFPPEGMNHQPSQPGKNPETEKEARLEWDRNTALREEFGGDFAAYTAYLKAEREGRIKIIGGRQ